MKTFSLFTELFNQKKHLFTLATLFLLTTSPLPIQAAGGGDMTEDKAHGLYQAGAIYGERSEVLFHGVIQKAPQEGQIGTWIVDGSKVLVSKSTVIKGEPAVDSFVELEGKWVVRNNIFKAYDLRVLNQADPLATGEFIGTIEEMPSATWPYGIWTVDNRKINVKKGLAINENNGKAKAGAEVAIKGSYVDGVFTASEFATKATSTK